MYPGFTKKRTLQNTPLQPFFFVRSVLETRFARINSIFAREKAFSKLSVHFLQVNSDYEIIQKRWNCAAAVFDLLRTQENSAAKRTACHSSRNFKVTTGTYLSVIRPTLFSWVRKWPNEFIPIYLCQQIWKVGLPDYCLVGALAGTEGIFLFERSEFLIRTLLKNGLCVRVCVPF